MGRANATSPVIGRTTGSSVASLNSVGEDAPHESCSNPF